MIRVQGGSRAAAQKGSMTYAFTHKRNYLLLFRVIGIWTFGLGFRPWGWGLDLGAGISASKLGFELGEGGTAKKKSRKEKKKDKIPHMCESIGHRPLLGRRPKGLETIEISQV